uniref:Gasdermin pore forming domain-containing protein n=1 Tax=Geospiza parvula TaxID=87175 RepID=A0A8C3MTN5_GEOPR
ARMFKKLTKFIVNQMDPCKELVPVESIADNEHFRPLYLLKKKNKSKTVFHRAPYYQRTGFTLDDVLLPGEDGKIPPYRLIPPRRLSCSWCSKHFLSFPSFREINMDHSFIRQLQRTDIKLYVVTEIIEASEEAVYKESTKADRGFKAKFYASLCAQSNREDKQSIVIPKGCTLAFRTIPLHIRDGAWGKQLPEMTKFSIPEGEDHFMKHLLPPELSSACLLIGGGGVRDRNHLGETHPHHTSGPTSHLPCAKTIHPKFPLSAHLPAQDKQQPLPSNPDISFPCSPQMEEVSEQNDGYQLNTESPDLKELFSTLQQSPRDRLLQLAEGITYVLDALQGEALGLQEGNQGRDDSHSCHSLLPSSHTPPPLQGEST